MAALLVLGSAARLCLILVTGTNGDLANTERFADTLLSAPLTLYSDQEAGGPTWPYPPGYGLVAVVVSALSAWLDVPFALLARVPLAATDAALSWLIAGELLRRGRGRALSLAGAAGWMVGPLPLAVTGIHGQIDSAMLLLVACALVLLRCWPGLGGAAASGVGFGAGACIKTSALFAAAAVAASLGWRRGSAALGAALAVPAVALSPWILADAAAVERALAYRGVPGVAGLSLILQPDLAQLWLIGRPVAAADPVVLAQALVPALAAAALLVVGVAVRNGRAPAPDAACLGMLAVCLVGVNTALHYLLWVLMPLLLAGRTRAAWSLQAALALPVLMIYGALATGTLTTPRSLWPRWSVVFVYQPYMLAALAAGMCCLGVWLRRSARASPRPAGRS